MKRLTICVLFLFGLLLSCTGCLHEPIESSVYSPETTPATTAPPAIDTSNFSYYVNISNESVWDLCPFMDSEVTYLFLSSEPLNNNAVVSLGFTHKYGSTHEEVKESWMTEFPFWLYQTYRGVDWNEVAKLAEASQNGNENAAQELKKYDTLYLEDYEALTVADIPSLYGYWITNNIATNQNASTIVTQFNNVPFQINNNYISLDVGCLNVLKKGWDQFQCAVTGEDIYAGRLPAACPTYWGDGTVHLAPIVIEAQAFPQVLTCINLFGIEGEIIDIQVSLDANTQSWDGKTNFEIPANTTAELIVSLQTISNRIVGYCEDANIMVQRDISGTTQRLWYFTSISQSWNIYELYALMVDGLDISSYYAYKYQWEKPEPLQKQKSTIIDFEEVNIADTSKNSLVVSHTSWDNYGYTVHFRAENRSEQILTITIGDTYINNCYCRLGYVVNLAPGEAGEYKWCLPWETIAEYGIYTMTGNDIKSIEFTFNPRYDGKYSDDASDNFIKTSIFPFGTEEILSKSNQCVSVLETDEVGVFLVHHGMREYSALTCEPLPLVYELTFLITNMSNGMISYTVTDIHIDGVPADGIDAATLRAGSSFYSTIANYLTEEDIAKIDEANTLTFTFIINDTHTYTAIIELTKTEG